MIILRELGESGSIAAAARKLGYTQPALAHHIKALEAEAGIALTRRVGRVVQLTEAGHLVASRGARIAAELSAAQDEISSLGRLESGVVRVAAFPSFAGRILPTALTTLAASHPGIDVRVIEAEPPQALELLLGEGCEVAAVFTDSDLTADQLPSRFEPMSLGSDPMRMVLPARHPLAGEDLVDMSHMSTEKWMAGCEKCRAQLDRLSGRAGFAPDVVYETDDYVAIQKFVAAGLGVAMLPQLALDVHQDPEVTVVPVGGAPSRLIGLVGPVVAGPATETVLAVLQSVWKTAYSHGSKKA